MKAGMIGKKIERDQSPKVNPIILQMRDVDIMILVSEFGLLSREQLQKLLDFSCITRINIRLKKLYDHGYLSRKFVPTLWGNPKILYYLGPEGTGIMAERLGLNADVLKKERESQQAQKDLFLNHRLFLNETRLAFVLSLTGEPDLQMISWIKEKDCPIEFRSHHGRKTVLRPDGYFCLSYQGKFYGYFLEADCSTMSHRQMKSKALSYLDYALSGKYQKDFGLKYFRVLLIAKTRERLLNLKESIEELTDKIFYLTTMDNFDRNQIFDPIWNRAGRRGLFPILER